MIIDIMCNNFKIMKKNQNSGRDMANVRKSNVSDPTIQGIKGHVEPTMS